MLNFFSTLFLVLALAIPYLGAGASDSMRDALYLLDAESNCFLVRGKLPTDGKVYCYDELMQQIRSLVTQQGHCLSENAYLITISFLNSFADNKKGQNERLWFQLNPDKGYLYRYPLFGSLINPSYIPPALRNFCMDWDPDGLQHLNHFLGSLMAYYCDSQIPVVIYLHCNVGKDRTGEAGACYLMQHKGYSYAEAVTLSQQIAQRDLRTMSMNGIRWYAYYLRDRQGYTSIGTID